MPSFDDHISQAKSNLAFLKEVNDFNHERYDWQVTVCLYCALHLVNAHVRRETGEYYQKHGEVNSAINPFDKSATAPVDESTYKAYIKLFSLSRRSRYLCHEGKKINDGHTKIAHPTQVNHLAKAIRNLDKIMTYFSKKYGLEFDHIQIHCQVLGNSENMTYFHKYVKSISQ